MTQITNNIASPALFNIVLVSSTQFVSSDKGKKVVEKKPATPTGGAKKKTPAVLPPLDKTASKRPEPRNTIDGSTE